MSLKCSPVSRTFHFDLKPGKSYTLKAFKKAYTLQAHTSESLANSVALQALPGRQVTHFAEIEDSPSDSIQLLRVYGPKDENGIPSLESVAIYTPDSTAVYDADDLTRAILFMHPNLAVLTAEAAPAVLDHITASKTFAEMSFTLQNLDAWNTTVLLKDDSGNPIKTPAGEYLYEYQLVDAVTHFRATVSKEATVGVNNDEALQAVRWNLLNGVPYIDISPAPANDLAFQAMAAGYRCQLQDPGPNFGISAEIVGLTDDFTLTLKLSNSYIRHCSVFASFLSGDGKTALIVPNNLWTELVEDAIKIALQAWTDYTDETFDFIFDDTNTLKYLGTISAESTFLGVPVSSSTSEFTFKLPADPSTKTGSDTLSKIRILCGSLGIPSGNDWDPQSAWIGIGLTAFFDLVIPTVALIATVGTPSNTLFDSIFKDWKFIVPIIGKIALAIEDIVEHPDMTGNDVSSFFEGLADSLLTSVLNASDVAEKLAFYFGAEGAVEAIPFVGWALKAEAIEATIEQLAQTVGEVVGSQRVVEFDITISMSAVFKLLPGDTGGFPATATTYTITAQYSDVTGYVYTADLPKTKISEIDIRWDNLPVGGTVTFLVAFYSKEGWLVGKGQTAALANVITEGQCVLAVPPITITELLYPLTAETTYQHQQLLQYSGGLHQWRQTPAAPAETAKNLGTGIGGNVLDQLAGIGLNNDLGILGYAWQASGQNVPVIGTNGPNNLPVYTFQNISFGPNPEAGLMFTPAGYNSGPRLAYLRSASEGTSNRIGGASSLSFFFLDPVADSAGGYHLRGIIPITDPSIPSDSPQRKFDQSASLSWGRFKIQPTSLAVHSTGIVVAVTSGISKLQILTLPENVAPSADAPWAQLMSGPGTREGLVSLPEVVAVAPNQTIFVLEAGNARIQAFSRGGHPVPAFPSLPTPYWIPLYSEASDSNAITYTSMSVEIKGYIYVLSYEGNGYEAQQFRLDIYTPEGNHLLRQRGINVAALTVDLWRNLYTLNYQVILGPSSRTEPSVSEWIPATPKPSTGA